MTARLDLIGLVVVDMGRSLAFYRKLGFDLPPDAETEPHVEVTLPGGLRIAWDTVDTVRSFDPGWTAPAGGHRVALAVQFLFPDEQAQAGLQPLGTGYSGEVPRLQGVPGNPWSSPASLSI